jgi:hypothetical protein
MKSYFRYLFGTLVLTLFVAKKTFAMCPVCTIAVGSTLVLLEKWGVDNTVSGLWIGGLLISTSFWTINFLKKKKWDFKGMVPLVILFYYISTIMPLYYYDLIGLPSKMIWGLDKVLVGVILGTIFFMLGHIVYTKIKAANNGRAWFPFQKVVMPILPLAILSVIFYFITK